MPDRWRPIDPRQREIHRLLLLVGGEPAAFFLDACRLMDGDLALEATTHVVAHLLRELNGSLRDVLRPMVPDSEWPARGTPNAQAKQIEAICNSLGIDDSDQLRPLWREVVDPLAELAHRFSRASPRPIAPEFAELWAKTQVVVHQLARRIEANYTRTLPLVDELAAAEPNVNRLRQEVPHSTVVLDRFFANASLNWLRPLRAEGYFLNPPPLYYDEDGSVSYVRWPQGQYLVRMAALAPDEVLEIGLALTTDNPEAHEALTDAALAMSPEHSVRLVAKVSEWLRTPAQWRLPFKVQDLIRHLIEGGFVPEGLSLLRLLMTTENLRRGQGSLGAHMLEELTAVLFPAAGVPGVELYAALLAESVAQQVSGPEDYSSIWRPLISTERYGDMRDALVSALRDASVAVVDSDFGLLGEVVATLEVSASSIFKRIALYLLSVHPAPELIKERLTSPDLLRDPNAIHEYNELADKHFAELSEEDKSLVRAAIDEGPGIEAEDPKYADRWRLQMFTRFPPPLPDDWQSEVDELSRELGAMVREPPRVVEAGFVGPNSPIQIGELAGMSVAAIAKFARDWEPAADDWQAPSREGFGRVLRTVVSQEPNRFAEGASEFFDADPTYVRSVLGGLREAHQNGHSFPWTRVIGLGLAALERPRTIEGRDARGMSGADPGWAWTWQELGHLLQSGLRTGEGAIPPDEHARVFEVISRLAEDEDPSLAQEEQADEYQQSAEMLALNSVRGAAVNALLAYACCVDAAVAPSERRLPTDVKAVLQRRLDPSTEPTVAVHSLFGKWLPWLVTADRCWAEARLGEIFPTADEPRRRAAFASYLFYNDVHENVFRILAGEYLHAIEALLEEPAEDAQAPDSPARRLIEHLMVALRYGLLSVEEDDGLVRRFYEIAPLAYRAQAIESLGRGLMGATEVTAAMADRLQGLLEWRVAAVAASDEEAAADELRGFAWWFGSGKLEPTWSLAQLEELLATGGRLEPDHVVAKRLAALMPDHPLPVLRCLEQMIETGTRQWFVIGARDEIDAILGPGIAAGGEAESRARDIVNRLVARGHVEYERYLGS